MTMLFTIDVLKLAGIVGLFGFIGLWYLALFHFKLFVFLLIFGVAGGGIAAVIWLYDFLAHGSLA